MTRHRPWTLGSPRRPPLPLVLGLIAGAATAGFAGYFVTAAWNGLKRCSSGGATGCAPHPFWGFSPELYLAACLIGVGAGAVTVGVATVGWWGLLERRRAGYALIALSAIGVIAYGGLGVGVVAGVVAGMLFVRSRPSRSRSPSAWSGSLPVGVPPVAPAARRATGGRPPVTEWNGIFATAPLGPPSRGRTKVALPSADRLSAALQRSRVSGGRVEGNPNGPAPVVVLPPPPVGLRSVPRDGGIVPRVPSLPPPPAVSRSSVPSAAPPGRGGPEPSAVSPWAASTRPVGTAVPAPAGPMVPGVAGTHAPTSQPSVPVPMTPTAPRSPARAAPLPASRGPLREYRPASGPTSPPPSTPVGSAPSAPPAPPRPAVAPLPASVGTPAGRGVAVLSVPPPRSARPTGTAGTPEPPRPPSLGPASPSRMAAPPGAPAAPEPTVKGRSRAWKCPQCGLVNAPWSSRCTRCQTAAPAG
jgi:hypothetical protein